MRRGFWTEWLDAYLFIHADKFVTRDVARVELGAELWERLYLEAFLRDDHPEFSRRKQVAFDYLGVPIVASPHLPPMGIRYVPPTTPDPWHPTRSREIL